MIDLSTIFSGELLQTAGKIAVLILIFLYATFSLVITLQVRSLRNTIHIARFNFSVILQLLFLLHLLLVISLFFFALAIL